MALGTAGVIEPTIFQKIKDEYADATGQQKYDASKAYSGQDGTLAYHVQEKLGMVGDTKRTKCYICGAPLSVDADRCAKCGSDVDIDY